MKTETNHALYQLIRDYMNAMGTSHTTLVALDTYMDAIGRIKCPEAAFMDHLMELNNVICNTEPKVVPLVHLIEEFKTEMQSCRDRSLEEAKQRAVAILRQKRERFESDTRKVTENCVQNIAPDDFIIAHSSTGYIRNAFIYAHVELKRKFRVLILKNNFLRTKNLVGALEQHQIPHLVIPEYNLSHFLQHTNRLFIGAVSVTADKQAVTGIGTANVVSLCRWHRVPVYLFVETIKFSHKALPDQHIYKEEQDHAETDFTFHMTTFSHDFIGLQMVDHLITEKGEAKLP